MDPLLTEKCKSLGRTFATDFTEILVKEERNLVIPILQPLLKYSITSVVLLLTQRILYYWFMI